MTPPADPNSRRSSSSQWSPIRDGLPQQWEDQTEQEAKPSILSGSKGAWITTRMTTYLKTVGILFVLALLGSTAFITFVWHANVSNPIWYSVAQADWVTRAVTITAVVLRTAVSFQAALATSMLASYALETSGVRLSQIPEVSFARVSSGGPLGLLTTLAQWPRSAVCFRASLCYDAM